MPDMFGKEGSDQRIAAFSIISNMTKSRSEDYREVYSTDVGALCPKCGKALRKCSCAEEGRARVLGDGQVKVRRETKGRGGKTVTTISGLPLNAAQLQELLTALKRAIGTGGALKDGVLEIQGEHCDLVMKELLQRGFKPKRSGG